MGISFDTQVTRIQFVTRMGQRKGSESPMETISELHYLLGSYESEVCLFLKAITDML